MNFLSPFGWLYGRAANVRNALYDSGTFAAHSLGARTISIGNIAAGGTGKTPLVALVAEILSANRETVCILTRGYGRQNPKECVLVSDGQNVLVDARTGGDEPVELAHKLIGKAVVIANADRVSAAKWAREKFGVTVFVLDDGFQHRRVKRDLDIVCIDATDPFGGGEILPAGRLREPLENIRRADVVVITRSNLAENIQDLKFQIPNLNSAAPIFLSENRITRVRPLEESLAKPQTSQRLEKEPDGGAGWERLRAERDPTNIDEEVSLMAFCALGNPDSFFFMLEEKLREKSMDEFDLGVRKKFPDHHIYRQQDIDLMEKQAKECRIDAFLTTSKDAVKLIELKFEIACYVVEMESIITDAAEFQTLITAS